MLRTDRERVLKNRRWRMDSESVVVGEEEDALKQKSDTYLQQ